MRLGRHEYHRETEIGGIRSAHPGYQYGRIPKHSVFGISAERVPRFEGDDLYHEYGIDLRHGASLN